MKALLRATFVACLATVSAAALAAWPDDKPI